MIHIRIKEWKQWQKVVFAFFVESARIIICNISWFELRFNWITYREIQWCHWRDSNWEIVQETPSRWQWVRSWPSSAPSASPLAWSWRASNGHISPLNDLQFCGKVPIAASTWLTSRTHLLHGICMSLSCFGWLPTKDNDCYNIQIHFSLYFCLW